MGVSDFLDPNADSLLDKFKLRKLLGRFGRATVVGLFTGVIGLWLAAKRSLEEFVGTVVFLLGVVVESITDPDWMAEIVKDTSSQPSGLLGLPVSVGVIVLSAIGISLVVALFLGWSE